MNSDMNNPAVSDMILSFLNMISSMYTLMILYDYSV